MASSELDYCTGAELVALLAARKVSAVELFERSVLRIEARDKAINAVVLGDVGPARDAGEAGDAGLARGQRRSRLGVPITVKESYNVAGLPTTCGFPAGKDFRPKEDALC